MWVSRCHQLGVQTEQGTTFQAEGLLFAKAQRWGTF